MSFIAAPGVRRPETRWRLLSASQSHAVHFHARMIGRYLGRRTPCLSSIKRSSAPQYGKIVARNPSARARRSAALYRSVPWLVH